MTDRRWRLVCVFALLMAGCANEGPQPFLVTCDGKDQIACGYSLGSHDNCIIVNGEYGNSVLIACGAGATGRRLTPTEAEARKVSCVKVEAK